MSDPQATWLITAASLWERLDALHACSCAPRCGIAAPSEPLDAVVDALGGREAARRWLIDAGVSVGAIDAVFDPKDDTGTCVVQHVAGLPWAIRAREALEGLERLEPRVLEPPPGMTLPLFPEVSAQLVRIASHRLEIPDRPGFANALASARVMLWWRLGRLWQHTLAADFQSFRAERAPRFVRGLAQRASLDQVAGRDVYMQWLASFRDTRARDLASEVPVLYRLTGEVIASWLDATSELFHRLVADWPDLVANFRLGPAAKLANATFGLSDPHDGGRSVVRLDMGSQRIFYKPRPLESEQLWADLLKRLEADAPADPYHCGMAAPASWLRPGYGYVAEAPTTALSPDGIERYHRELGAVLVLFYALNGTDGHMQNLVVSRGHPVLVDLETLLDAPISKTEFRGTRILVQTVGAGFLQRHSVAATGLLPQWVKWEDRVMDHSAIGAHAANNTIQAATRVVVENLGSVDLAIREESVTTGTAPSIPMCEGQEVAAIDHVDDVVEGFRLGHDRIARARDWLWRECAERSPTIAVRHVVRPTRGYAFAANALLAQRWLASGIVRTAAMLQALHQREMEKSQIWPRVVLHEMRAMDRGDIPLFSVRVDQQLLLSGGEVVGPWFEQTPLAALREKLSGLSDGELGLQTRLIRVAFAARVAEESAPAELRCETRASETLLGEPTRSEDHVAAITSCLEAEALDVDGGSAWLTLAHDPKTERYEYRLADHGVFAGSAGTAMFLAAASRVLGREGPAERANRALHHSVAHLAQADDLAPSARALSVLQTAFAGAWMVRCGVRDEVLDSRLEQLVSELDPAVLRADRHLDVLFGSASGLLAAKRAAEVFAWGRLAECAEVCTEQLLCNQVLDGDDAGGWRTETSPDHCISGYSHGVSGIVYALAAAAPRDDGCVERAIERALAFESRCFDREAGTWSRSTADASHGASWCHGAPGIGLARAGLLRVGWDSVGIREDLDRALDACRRYPGQLDTFCCGAAGISELFLVAGDLWRSESLIEEGRAWLARTVLRGEPGSYELGTSTNRVCHPGLYQGWPGIAYLLLRSRTTAWPSFALWDLPDPAVGSAMSPSLDDTTLRRIARCA